MASTVLSVDAADTSSTIAASEDVTESSATLSSLDKILASIGIKKVKSTELLSGEVFWRDQCQFLKEHGYTLRARYQPDWKPSWLGTSKQSSQCEDGETLSNRKVMDASRNDGSLVMFKCLHREDDHLEILLGKDLSGVDRQRFPENHCVPFLEVLEPPDCEYVIVVMPYLVRWDIVPFETIGEVIEFFRQIFEGLLFMHDLNIAHEDIKFNNILADAVSLFSYPPHPGLLSYHMKRDFSGSTEVLHSRTTCPIRYHLIDFGLSNCFDSKSEASQETPFGGTKNCPEVWQPDAPPCNPFLVDVFCMGNVVHGFLFDEQKSSIRGPKRGFEFMRELVDDMMNTDPLKRPSMKEVVERYEVIYNGLSEWKLRSPVVTVGERFKLRKAAVHWKKQLVRMARGIPAIPRA
ncbi:hypothetical protein H2248_004364 [Termitomyces sp. 'cryptogamus']|nr:hypothetical protein H2248_004364 [Termitomyces sp. 'cryptogamus']